MDQQEFANILNYDLLDEIYLTSLLIQLTIPHKHLEDKQNLALVLFYHHNDTLQFRYESFTNNLFENNF